MEQTKVRDKKSVVLAIIAVLLIISNIYLAYRLVSRKSETPGEEAQSASESIEGVADSGNATDSKTLADGILIPGTDLIYLSSNELTQGIRLYNPSDNNCWFIISLRADGEEIYRSERLEPGEELWEIQLSRSLEQGSYEGLMIYDCYSMTDDKQLNGARIKLTVTVK